MANLFDSDDSRLWIYYLNKYDEAIKIVSTKKKQDDFPALDRWLWIDLKNDVYNRQKTSPVDGFYLTKNELSKIMKWKLTRGQFRPLQKMIDSNSEDVVKLHTGKALAILCSGDNNINWKSAATELIKLKGVGIATASICLAIFAPNLCPFMSDEIINLTNGGKLDYTMSVYTTVQKSMADKMKILNASSEVQFDTEMMGKAIWTLLNL